MHLLRIEFMPWIAVKQSKRVRQRSNVAAAFIKFETLLFLLRQHVAKGGFVSFRHEPPSAFRIAYSKDGEQSAFSSDFQDYFFRRFPG